MKTTILVLLFVALSGSEMLFAQAGGNNIYDDNSNYTTTNNQNTKRKQFSPVTYLTDSTFLVKSSVLLNTIADYYVVTFAVHEDAATTKECSEKITNRINGFQKSLESFGIKKEETFVDFITQTMIYDYKITGNLAEQFLEGFLLNKNVIVKFTKIEQLDQMMLLASNFQIYDIAKVEYVVNDVNKFYNQLFQVATQVINQKKQLYVGLTNVKLEPVSEIFSDDFSSYYPPTQYQSYRSAFETSKLDYSYYDKMRVKDQRKTTTFFFQKLDYTGFDQIINPMKSEPQVQFVLNLAVKFKISKK